MEKSGFLEEMEWRGMHFDHTPGVENYLKPGVRGYIGFDPTSDSLTIGNFVQLMILALFQKHGHQPIVLMGGATGRIGDPSGKDKERELKSTDEIDANVEAQAAIIRRILDFDKDEHPAIMINNHDFYREMNVLDFLRDVGKTLTVNYMMSKESVKKRIETGLSFTEFSYQLLQGYDFQVLYNTQNCALQMGGSDQWGNITSGTEFIRRNSGGKAYGITTPLLTKSDGSKMGKSESGAIWLSADKTSPYQFYQYWLNADDADLERLIKYFSLKSREEMQAMIAQVDSDPRQVKKDLAAELTARIHGPESLDQVEQVSALIFSKSLNAETLSNISQAAFDMVAMDIPGYTFHKSILDSDKLLVDFLTEDCEIFPSKSEFRRAVKGNALSVNKSKVSDEEMMISLTDLIHGKYLMVENGKKNKYLLTTH
jgi:tyrosyl-tRNA synthetase